ncbi:aminotransferase class I/II-fold pyridoxal phosphate-dependent enzyme, partial [bacterium]|nr:aminotransferase class I/II-fold pyridoxal phosphate-dependent enzyme [bacterium]
TEGIKPLLKAIIRYTEENYSRIPSTDNIVVANGAKQALFNVLFTLLNPQDQVVILAPYWVSYPEMIKMIQGVPVVVKPDNDSFQIQLEDIDDVVGGDTKAIIMNSPNNPSGIMYDEAFVKELVEYCEERGIWLITDDIYHKLIFDGRKWPNPYEYTSKDLDDTRIISINGISKVYGMTGFRVGWSVAPKKLTEIMINVQAQTTSTTSVVLQAAAAGALNGVQSVIENLRLTIQNNRDVLMQELSTFDNIRVVKPHGTFYALADFRAYEQDSVKLSKFLLEKALVVTVPGKEFGMEGFLRISYATTVKDIKVGVERMKWALDPNSPNEIYFGDKKVVRDWL